MSVAGGFYILVMLSLYAGFVVVLFVLQHGDQVKAGFQVPGVQLFLSYRRNRRE